MKYYGIKFIPDKTIGKKAQQIDMCGFPNNYGIPMLFKTKKQANVWIKAHSYSYMSCSYEITVVEVDEK